MYAAENAYLSMEASTQHILDNISSYYPGYDEYNVSADSIGHDPYILISILSTLHEGVFTIGDVQSELDILFALQYEFTVEAVTETRYYTETMVESYEVTDEETGEVSTVYYEYEVEVPYDYYILNVTFHNIRLETLPAKILNEEQLNLFATYMATLGNREDLFPDSQYNQ